MHFCSLQKKKNLQVLDTGAFIGLWRFCCLQTMGGSFGGAFLWSTECVAKGLDSLCGFFLGVTHNAVLSEGQRTLWEYGAKRTILRSFQAEIDLFFSRVKLSAFLLSKIVGQTFFRSFFPGARDREAKIPNVPQSQELKNVSEIPQ